jgi:aminoglycoside 3-N-acetyltransferase
MTDPEELQISLSNLLTGLGLKEEETCYIAGNISALARTRLKKDVVLPRFIAALQNVIGPMGTIFSPSASMNLCNTSIPFDIGNTPSHEMGALAEYIRQANGSIRSFHPFWSISGIGKKSNILQNVSRHSYGVGSPWSKFLDLDTRQINVGLHPSKAVTLIHHIEVATGVPYRYTKEFIHPVIQTDGSSSNELFYMSVMYHESDILKRLALNEHYFNEMEKKNLLSSATHSSGLKLWTFKMRDFYDVATSFFIDDIYNYLEHPPKIRPYTS